MSQIIFLLAAMLTFRMLDSEGPGDRKPLNSPGEGIHPTNRTGRNPDQTGGQK